VLPEINIDFHGAVRELVPFATSPDEHVYEDLVRTWINLLIL
jgi:hypothetical protein